MSGKPHKKKTNPPASAREDDDRDDDDDDFEEDEEDDEDDDDDEYEPGVDDHETLRVERERMEHADGRQWTEISSTLSSITYAMPIYEEGITKVGLRGAGTKGTVLLVKSWGPDGDPMQSMVWLPGVTPGDVEQEPPSPRREPEQSGGE